MISSFLKLPKAKIYEPLNKLFAFICQFKCVILASSFHDNVSFCKSHIRNIEYVVFGHFAYSELIPSSKFVWFALFSPYSCCKTDGKPNFLWSHAFGGKMGDLVFVVIESDPFFVEGIDVHVEIYS